MARVFGITGSFGSGKSSVAAVFRDLGVPVQDADEVARDVVRAGTDGLRRVVERFGPAIGPELLDASGELDRKRLAAHVFSDPAARADLNAIVHPLVRAEQGRFLGEHAKAPAVALEIPLLLESGARGLFEKVIVVAAPEDLRRERLRKKGFSDEEIAARLASQMPQEKKIEMADFVVWNDGDLETLRERVVEFLRSVHGLDGLNGPSGRSGPELVQPVHSVHTSASPPAPSPSSPPSPSPRLS